METLCIVPCGKKKIWDDYPDIGPTNAKEAYTGIYAKKCIQYAECFYSDDYFILSDKYGFLHPNDTIPGNYDVNFKRKETNPITTNELSSQFRMKKLNRYKRIIVVAGMEYFKRVKAIAKGQEVIHKFMDVKTQGEQLGLLKKLIDTGNP